MEKRLNEYVDTYMADYKEFIRGQILDSNESNNKKIKAIFDYAPLNIEIEKFSKKKRARNIIPNEDRCIALRANKERCTRKKKEGGHVCGTHLKATPHGVINSEESNVNIKKIEIFTQDITGITYYLDKDDNIYCSNDIMKGIQNPAIIGRCKKESNGSYTFINI